MQKPTQYPVINWNRAAQQCSTGVKEFFPLAPTPHDEPCTQAGQDEILQLIECTALINQLKRLPTPPAPQAQYFIIENTGHEFGTYYEVGIFYIPTPEDQGEEEPESDSEQYAMIIEQNIPDKWDAEALKELREAGHPLYQPAKVVQMNAA